MEERDTGLILRVRPLTESSLVVNWLAKEAGRISTVAKGARQPKSAFLGKLDLYYLAEFSFSRNRRSDLHILREVSVRETPTFLRKDIMALQKAAYVGQLIELATEAETPIPEVFALMQDFMLELASARSGPETVLACEVKFLVLMGLEPNLETSGLTAGARQICQRMNISDWPALANLRLTPPQAGELSLWLGRRIGQEWGRLPPARRAALHCIAAL